MSVTLSSLAGAAAQFFDNNGVPLTGGLIYTYTAGTTTPAATYTSSTGLTAHANPIVLDAAGRIATGEIWLTTGVDYKFLVKTSANVQLGSYDNIPSINDLTNLANTTNPALGDALVGFRQSNASGNLTGAVGRTVHQKLQETISVKDFGAVGDGTTNDTTAITNAFAAAGTQPVFFLGGDFYAGPSGYDLQNGNSAISYTDGLQKNVFLNTRKLTGVQAIGAGTLSGFSPTAYMYDTLEDCDVGADFFIGIRNRHRFGGSAVKGGRIGIYSQVQNTSATNAGNLNRNYVAIQGSIYADSSDNGTDLGANAKGAYFGGGFATYVAAAAQNLLNITGAEFNTFVSAGASVKYQFGLQIAGANAQRGGGYDAAISISGIANPTITHAGYGVGILFNSANGAEPFSTDSTIIAAVTNGTVTIQTGIDFSAYTMTQFIIAGKYSKLSESGLTIGDSGGNSLLIGGAQSTNANFLIRPKGTGSLYLQNSDGSKTNIQCNQDGAVLMPNLPSSSVGLPSGALWRNGTTVSIIP